VYPWTEEVGIASRRYTQIPPGLEIRENVPALKRRHSLPKLRLTIGMSVCQVISMRLEKKGNVDVGVLTGVIGELGS
jgi:hypothetical protein